MRKGHRVALLIGATDIMNRQFLIWCRNLDFNSMFLAWPSPGKSTSWWEKHNLQKYTHLMDAKAYKSSSITMFKVIFCMNCYVVQKQLCVWYKAMFVIADIAGAPVLLIGICYHQSTVLWEATSELYDYLKQWSYTCVQSYIKESF